MKRNVLAMVAVVLLFAACKKENKCDDRKPFADGVYKGTFKRYNQPGSATADVTLTFNYPNWTGSSSIEKYPALCNGKYSYHDYILKFSNACSWTTDFDGTFILDGLYQDKIEGDSVVFSKSYGNGFVDVYKLKKQ